MLVAHQHNMHTSHNLLLISSCGGPTETYLHFHLLAYGQQNTASGA